MTAPNLTEHVVDAVYDHLCRINGEWQPIGPNDIKEVLTAAAPFLPVQGSVKKLEDAALSESVNSYASSYEFQGDNGDYTPTDGERVMIEDAIEGFLSNFLAVSEPSAARELAFEEGYRQGIEAAAQIAERPVIGFSDGAVEASRRIASSIRALSSPDHADAGKVEGDGSFQSRVKPWMLACFGEEISNDKLERCDRFVEEALELVQAIGYSPDRARALVDYVFNREIGEPHQEVGGVMVTLAALCLAAGLEMDEAGEDELARIWTKVEKIRAKQAAKPTGSALPIPTPPSGEVA